MDVEAIRYMRGWILALCMSLAAIGMPNTAKAIDQTQMNQVTTDIVSRMCFKVDWLVCYGEKPSRCHELMNPIAQQCVNKHLRPVIQELDLQRAADLTGRIVKCLNTSFFATRKKPEQLSEQCQKAVRHLL